MLIVSHASANDVKLDQSTPQGAVSSESVMLAI